MSGVHPGLYWLIIGVMLFLMELFLPGFILFFFALGALLTAAVAYFFPVSLAWQLAVFTVTSVLTLLGLRNFIQRRFFAKAPESQEDDGPDNPLAHPGDKGVVSSAIIPPAEGRIKYNGSFWRATADERIEEGEIIVVVRQKGLVIHVEKI